MARPNVSPSEFQESTIYNEFSNSKTDTIWRKSCTIALSADLVYPPGQL